MYNPFAAGSRFILFARSNGTRRENIEKQFFSFRFTRVVFYATHPVCVHGSNWYFAGHSFGFASKNKNNNKKGYSRVHGILCARFTVYGFKSRIRPMRAYRTRTRERIIMSCAVTIHVPCLFILYLLLTNAKFITASVPPVFTTIVHPVAQIAYTIFFIGSINFSSILTIMPNNTLCLYCDTYFQS